MAEMTIQLRALELMEIIRNHYKCPTATQLRLEVFVNDETEYPGNMQNEFKFRISDANIASGFSDALIFEYDLQLHHTDEKTKAEVIEKMVVELQEESEVKNVYNDIV
jgi:hypothetical protein